jgi:adenylosuccinate synthase
VEVVYKDMKGLAEDLSGMTEASQLPAALNAYIDFLEKELETPIKIVSVGPDRTQTILR